MANIWILVANSSFARVYEHLGPNKGIKLVKEMDHPESRFKNSELVTDRSGSMSAVYAGKGSKQPQTQPKTHQAKLFAQKLAQELYQGRTQNAYKRAIVFAPPAFMGMLNTQMDQPTAELVTDRFEKDYTKAAEPQLRKQLASCLLV